MGNDSQAAGSVATAAKGLETYMVSFVSHEAFRASAAALAMRAAQDIRNNRSGQEKAKGWIAEYNRLVREAKSVFAKDPHVQGLKALPYTGSARQIAGGVATAARTFARTMENKRY